MANARRSIGDAMTLSPEKLAFIQGSTKLPSEPKPPVELESTRATGVDSRPEVLEVEASVEETKPKRTRSNVRPRATVASDDMVEMAPILAPLTTRLHPDTADALRRACLEQRLARRKPHTQQEIVELAVRRWLDDNGFR